jgi:hypothetical protein
LCLNVIFLFDLESNFVSRIYSLCTILSTINSASGLSWLSLPA